MASADRSIRRHPAYRAVVRRWPEKGLLACSGGVDSSALLALAGTAVQRGDLPPFVVVHVDHLTRDEGAAEGEVVEALAMRFGLQTVRTTVDAADAEPSSSSPEDRLRRQRYAVLARVAVERGSPAVVTAHTRDDQIETILMRLLTGAGGIATAGMQERSVLATAAGEITIHRPLLDTSRADLLGVLDRLGIEPLHDPTNADRGYRRNALRLDIIPAIRLAYPGFEAALARSVGLAAQDSQALDGWAERVAKSTLTSDDASIRVERAALREVPAAVASRIIRMAASRMMPDNPRELTFERVESIRLATSGRTGAMIELPYGVLARIERHEIVFERRNH
ncbi:MAG TPA: tRNA lysidine(34) synthetase TilS [Thermomicrobiales bacterium]|nr:tRNA lysidine(34) synthetase TilS [Thermomicrobiales bacterium]